MSSGTDMIGAWESRASFKAGLGDLQHQLKNKLAVTMGLERTVVYRWTSERTDPVGIRLPQLLQPLPSLILKRLKRS